MIHVQQRALGALEEHPPLGLDRVEQVGRGIGQVRTQPPGVAVILVEDLLRIEPLAGRAEGVEHLVLGLGDRFDVVIAGDRVARGKPAPDLFLAAARALDATPDICLVLEDSAAGVAAAKRAGMTCVAVPDLRVSRPDLSEADFVVDSLHQVPNLIFEL